MESIPKKMRKRNTVKTGYFFLVLVLLYVVLMLFGMFRSNYRAYHARMHGAPVWGRIIRVDDHVGQNGGYLKCRVEYAIGDESYFCYTGELPKRFQDDSLVVVYDTTNVREAFVLLRNPKDAKTAFFKSQKDYMPLRWQQDYDKCLQELEKKRLAHRERKHFYDRFCQDD